MSEKFSPTLRITDLNDFIAPSQACVLSVKGLKPTSSKQEKPKALSSTSNSEPVKISLKDCLACSGCITSAETVMLEKQSSDEFLANISMGKMVFVSLSPQSRASLAAHFGLSPLQTFQKLTTFFKSLGVKAVFDTSCGRDLALIEACNEFVRRYKQNNPSGCIDDTSNSALPVLSSACPGWICYAEKTLGSYILPYISSVRSPQQIMGAVIKNHICKKMGVSPDVVYHVTVMPCYDKKLEAARDDFTFSVESQGEHKTVTEVDSVLTSGEVLDLIKQKTMDFRSLRDSPLEMLMMNVTREGDLFGVRGSSGGYADTVFRYAAKLIFGEDIRGPLDFKTIRNSDFQEVTLEVDGETVLKFALCYGFRNLQNITRRIKTGKCDYHFVEVMACPSGCLNGGGQIKPKPGQPIRDLLRLLEDTYSNSVLVADPHENQTVKELYGEWLDHPGSEKSRCFMHTEYHPIVKSVASQLHNW